MTTELITLSEAAARKLADDHTRLVHEVLNLRRQAARKYHPPAAKLTRIPYLNTSGEEIPERAIMRPTTTTYVAGKALVNVGKPNTTFEKRYMVNDGLKCPVGGKGAGTWLEAQGEIYWNAASGTPSYGDQWGPTSGQWYAVKNRPGFEILGASSGSGATATVIAYQRIVTELFGKPALTVTKGSTDTVAVWFRNASTGADEDSGMTVMAKALLADLPAGKFCGLVWDCGRWAGLPGECEA